MNTLNAVNSESPTCHQPMRKPNPNEHRLIARHAYKFYNNIVVAGVYNFPIVGQVSKIDRSAIFARFRSALRQCIKDHTFLSVVVSKIGSKDMTYSRCENVDLTIHLNVINADDVASKGSDEDGLFCDTISHVQNDPQLTFFESAHATPPWRLDVLRLEGEGHPRFLVAFTYSHILGDGMSGMAFHKTLLRSLRLASLEESKDVDIAIGPDATLPSLSNLPISLSYLLVPALGHYLPNFIRHLFGLKASVSGVNEATWIGSRTFAESTTVPVKTALESLTLSASTLSAILLVCRTRGTKLTAVLNEVIALSFSAQQSIAAKTSNSQPLNFISSTPINLRKLAACSDDIFGIMASTAYTTHQFRPQINPKHTETTVDEQFWEDAKRAANDIQTSASTLQDQPIGLLRFISDIDGWMANQIDYSRDSSWTLSNLMSFDGGNDSYGVFVEKMRYSQPADAVGPPLSFNVVSTRDGDLSIYVAWQPGALGLFPTEQMEDAERGFVRALMGEMDKHLQAIALLSSP